MNESVIDNYETLKLAVRRMRTENMALMKPRGFDIKITPSKQGYWNSNVVKININTPEWFEWCRDGSYWVRSDKANKLINSITKRIVTLILDISNDPEEKFSWEYTSPPENKYDDILNGIDFKYKVNGYN